MSAIFRINQDGVPGAWGTARQDMQLFADGGVITLEAQDAGAENYFWELISEPEGSSVTVFDSTLQLATVSLTVTGGYIVRLTTDDGLSAKDISVMYMGVPLSGSGLCIPAFNETVQDNSEGTTYFGWERKLTRVLKWIDGGISGTLVWQRLGTEISNITPGDHVLINEGTETDSDALRLINAAALGAGGGHLAITFETAFDAVAASLEVRGESEYGASFFVNFRGNDEMQISPGRLRIGTGVTGAQTLDFNYAVGSSGGAITFSEAGVSAAYIAYNAPTSTLRLTNIGNDLEVYADVVSMDAGVSTSGDALVLENDAVSGGGGGDLGIQLNFSGGSDAGRFYIKGDAFGRSMYLDVAGNNVLSLSASHVTSQANVDVVKTSGLVAFLLSSVVTQGLGQIQYNISTDLMTLGSQNALLLEASLGYVELSASDVIYLNADVKTDRWLESASNIFLGINVAGAGNLSHASGSEGWYNTGVGADSLNAITTGNTNVAVGYAAGASITSGISHTAIGAGALNAVVTGVSNVAIGSNALLLCTGDSNTVIGAAAGDAITSGDNNIVLGAGLAVSTPTADNQINIGDVLTGVMVTGDITVTAVTDLFLVARGASSIPFNEVGYLALTGSIAGYSIIRALNTLEGASGAGWVLSSNVDVDIGTEDVDTFNPTGDGGVVWHYFISHNTSNQMRAGTFVAHWDDSAGTAVFTETSTSSLGDTTPVTLSVDMSGVSGTVRLRATTTSDDWTVRAIRTLII